MEQTGRITHVRVHGKVIQDSLTTINLGKNYMMHPKACLIVDILYEGKILNGEQKQLVKKPVKILSGFPTAHPNIKISIKRSGPTLKPIFYIPAPMIKI